MRTLLLHTAFPGDLVLLTPLIDTLRSDPDLEELVLLTTPAAAELFVDDPRLDSVITYDKRGRDAGIRGLFRKILELRSYDIERVISPHRSLRSSLMVASCGAYERIGFSTSRASLVFTDLVYDNRSLHEIDRNLSLVKSNINGIIETPSLYDSSVEIAKVSLLLDELGVQSPLAIVPSSAKRTKRWPPSRFAELAEKIINGTPLDVVLLGHDNDQDLLATIIDMLEPEVRRRVHNLAGMVSLRESYQVFRNCILAVVNEGVSLQLAQAAGVPTLAIFGSTLPEFGFGPRKPVDHIFEVDLECRPCGLHGKQKCPINTFDCLEKITAEQVFACVREVYERTSPKTVNLD
jgi:heptosyltransferase II